MDRYYDLLDGKFPDEVFTEIDFEVSRLKARKKIPIAITGLLMFFALLFPYIAFDSGITSFVIFNPNVTANLSVNQNYTTNTTVNYNFINTTSVKITGNLYGYGEAWVYLISGGIHKLLHAIENFFWGGVKGYGYECNLYCYLLFISFSQIFF